MSGSRQSADKNHAGLYIAIENYKIFEFDVSEETRVGASNAVGDLFALGNRVEILSGDGKQSVTNVASITGINDFAWEQSPTDKTEHIKDLRGAGKTVLMVGDGLNDSPALVAANVSMAPANASDIARQSADFVFTRETLGAVPFTIKISRKAGRLVKQNFALAILYNAVAVPFAMAGYVTPLIAAVAMSASSIVVIANSMRLNSGKGEINNVTITQVQSVNEKSHA
jgi:Cu2+-exporting ATPase